MKYEKNEKQKKWRRKKKRGGRLGFNTRPGAAVIHTMNYYQQRIKMTASQSRTNIAGRTKGRDDD